MSNNKTNHSSCLGVVLAGGLSRRMGENKAQLTHFNQREEMLQFSQQLLLDAGVNNVVISGDNFQVSDKYQQLGPLAGIYSVIQQCQPQAILVLPVDLPLMNSALLSQLKLTGELSGKATYFDDNYLPLYLPNNGYSQLIFNKTFSRFDAPLSNTNSAMSELKKGPSMKRFIESIPHQCLAIKNHQALFNCNTPSQWQQAQALFSKNNL
ncbi:MAG: molybdenum cofactor guanylyltransferase [Thalassotalea sp.]